MENKQVVTLDNQEFVDALIFYLDRTDIDMGKHDISYLTIYEILRYYWDNQDKVLNDVLKEEIPLTLTKRRL